MAPLDYIIPLSSLFRLTNELDPIPLHVLWGNTVNLLSIISAFPSDELLLIYWYLFQSLRNSENEFSTSVIDEILILCAYTVFIGTILHFVVISSAFSGRREVTIPGRSSLYPINMLSGNSGINSMNFLS